MTKRKKWILIGLFLTTVVMFLMFATFLVIIGAMFGPPYIPDNGVLMLDIQGSIPEIEDRGLLEELVSPPRITVGEYTKILREAAYDNRVVACLVSIRPIAEGWATVSELRRAITEFGEKSKKPIVAVLDIGTNKEIYLASAADRVFMAEEGDLILGMHAEVPYIKNALGKLRIEADFESVGKYKDGPETFTRDGMSETSREAFETLVDGIYDDYMSVVATARPGCATQDVEAAVDRSLLSAEYAVSAHLVDEVGHLAEAKNYLVKSASSEFELEDVPADDYLADIRFRIKGLPKATFAFIVAEGPIYLGNIGDDLFGSTGIGSDGMVEDIKEIIEDSSIDAIILRVDSPGGSMLASDLIWKELERAKQAGKKIYVSMGDVAASGGYYISMGADHIVAESNTITGSIGIYTGKLDLGNFYEWIGVNHSTVKRGENAGFLSSTGKFTDGQRAIIRELIESSYQRFVQKAADGRKVSFEEMAEKAEGRVWSGSDALKLGLIDEIGGIYTTIEAAKRDLGIAPDEKVRLLTYPKSRGFLGTLRSGKVPKAETGLPSSVTKTLGLVKTLERLQQEPTLALWPEGLDLDM